MATISAAATSGLGQDQFLQLLLAQVQNQNPLEPVKDTEFIAQLAQFNSLSNLQQLNASFDQILKLQSLTSGADLIGKTVAYSTTGGGSASGKVDQVTADGKSVFLQVGTARVGLDQVTTILA